MRPLVIDASAALGLLLGEEDAGRVEALVRQRRTVMVPALFWIEVVNSLARRHRWRESNVTAAVHDLESMGLQTEPPSRLLLMAVIDAVEAHGLTAYDATYLVLAESADADLLTGDAFLATAARDRAILIGQQHRLAEARVRYDTDRRTTPDWPAWPGAAAYLRELRREIEGQLAAARARSANARG